MGTFGLNGGKIVAEGAGWEAEGGVMTRECAEQVIDFLQWAIREGIL
jgi:hypothetical protein